MSTKAIFESCGKGAGGCGFRTGGCAAGTWGAVAGGVCGLGAVCGGVCAKEGAASATVSANATIDNFTTLIRIIPLEKQFPRARCRLPVDGCQLSTGDRFLATGYRQLVRGN